MLTSLAPHVMYGMRKSETLDGGALSCFLGATLRWYNTLNNKAIKNVAYCDRV